MSSDTGRCSIQNKQQIAVKQAVSTMSTGSYLQRQQPELHIAMAPAATAARSSDVSSHSCT